MLAADSAPDLPDITHGLTPRWTRFDRYSRVQREYFWDEARIILTACGRRSGKTEEGKRKLDLAAMAWDAAIGKGRFIFAAPTHDQAREIFWDDLKAMVPKHLVREVREGDREVVLLNGTKLQVRGLDKPARIEGSPVHGIHVAEFGDCRPDVFGKHIRPAISTRGQEGFCILDGVPRGGIHGHFAQLWGKAHGGEIPGASAYRWKSLEVLDPEEVDLARKTLDPLTFQQEYEAEFTTFGSRAYYTFERPVHVVAKLEYDPSIPLSFCFDFNVEPGVAVVAQEQGQKGRDGGWRYQGLGSDVAEQFSAVLGEVFIPRNSNTLAVCHRLQEDWGHHVGEVRLYGDLTGGARRTSSRDNSSDWSIILSEFRKVSGWSVRDMRHKIGTGKANPAERSRINALCARLRNGEGAVGMLFDGRKATHTAKCVEGTMLLEGGSGQIDKQATPELTHSSDALGYYVVAEFPVHKRIGRIVPVR